MTRALQYADVIVLLGARLNWILHFGLPPRFQPDVKVIQVFRQIFLKYFFFYIPELFFKEGALQR